MGLRPRASCRGAGGCGAELLCLGAGLGTAQELDPGVGFATGGPGPPWGWRSGADPTKVPGQKWGTGVSPVLLQPLTVLHEGAEPPSPHN